MFENAAEQPPFYGCHPAVTALLCADLLALLFIAAVLGASSSVPSPVRQEAEPKAEPVQASTPDYTEYHKPKEILAVLKVGMTREKAVAAVRANPDGFVASFLRINALSDRSSNSMNPTSRWREQIIIDTYAMRDKIYPVCAMYFLNRPRTGQVAWQEIPDTEWVLQEIAEDGYFPATGRHTSFRRGSNGRWDSGD
jgi:hypothetical protein